jgi:hypothetical protein
MDTALLFYWLRERQRIYRAREAGKHAPWTDDPWLRDYAWCNVTRQQDATTVYLMENWYQYLQTEDLPMAAVVARKIVRLETLKDVAAVANNEKLPVIERVLRKRQRDGHKIFTGAYIGQTRANVDPIDYLMKSLREAEQKIDSLIDESSVERTVKQLQTITSIGAFTANQIALDLTYTDVLRNAYDVDDYVHVGPGAIKGINVLYGHDVGQHISQHTALLEVQQLTDVIQDELGSHDQVFATYHVADTEHALCETYKYYRATQLGRKPRQRYRGSHG